MYKYILYYDGGFLRDSADLGYTFETEEMITEWKALYGECNDEVLNHINNTDAE